MRHFLGISLGFLAVCLFVDNAAFAQGQGGRGRGGFGGGQRGSTTTLLLNPQVQKELNLNDDQTAKVKDLLGEFAFGGQRGQRGQGQQASQEEREARAAERQKKSDEAGQKALALLTPEQTARFKQVQVWVQGTAALTQNDEVVKQLSLTDDQKGAIKTITEESAKKGRDLYQGFGRNASDEDRKKAGEQMATLRSETEAECMAVLTDDQKAKFEKLKGPKFQLDMPAGGGRGGRRRGGNNN
jgi:Spy/CpxP family protein refolding chaperone